MTTDREQLAKALEQTAPTSETEQREAVSNPMAQTSEEVTQKQQEAKAYQKMQSRFDTLQTRLDKAEALLKQRAQAESKTEADKRVKAQVARLLEAGENEEAVESYEKARLKYNEEAAKLNDRATSLDERDEILTPREQIVNAKEALLAHNPTPAVLKEAVPYLIKISKGDPEIMAELAELAITKFKKTEETEETPEADETTVTKPKSKRPDGTYHSAPGGNNLDSMSPIQKVTLGLARSQKKK